MLETVVIAVAVAGSVAIVGLMFYATHQADLNLRRRVQSAESGGRPLSANEQAAVRARGYRSIPADEDVGGWYARYRRRNALTRTQVRIGALMLGYMVVFGIAVALLGMPLGLLAMYLLGQAAVVLYVLLRRHTATDR